MTTRKMKLHDVVRLKQDRDDLGIKKRFDGVVVDVYEDGTEFLIEFFDDNGETIDTSFSTEFSVDEVVYANNHPSRTKDRG